MKRNRTESLNPRKKPQQRRSRVTIDTIFEATIQVLLANGLDRITTIQIADRAGVSVGSLYQYFPNKRALLAAVVKRHVSEVVDATIAACKSAHGKTIGEMCATMMAAFVDAKTRRPEVSRALYLPSAAVNADAIVKEESSRCALAVHDMLITASDAKFAQPQLVSRRPDRIHRRTYEGDHRSWRRSQHVRKTEAASHRAECGLSERDVDYRGGLDACDVRRDLGQKAAGVYGEIRGGPGIVDIPAMCEVFPTAASQGRNQEN